MDQSIPVHLSRSRPVFSENRLLIESAPTKEFASARVKCRSPAETDKTPFSADDSRADGSFATRGHAPTSRSKRFVQSSPVLDLGQVDESVLHETSMRD